MAGVLAHHDTALWFDVEKRYKTIGVSMWTSLKTLWFDVEKRYKTKKVITGTL